MPDFVPDTPDFSEPYDYGILYCRTGTENQVARDMQLLLPASRALCPVRLRYRRVGDKMLEEKASLFPGYIFFRLSENTDLSILRMNGLIYKILTDHEGYWQLHGADRALAEKIFADEGVFGFSKAFYVNDRIHIVDGPLKDYEGQITKVNHRKRTAQVVMDVKGISMTVWLGFELIDRPEGSSGVSEP